MRRRFLVPETIQTSGVDCGPAALKSLLEGFGIAASYGRLREACQTSLDGTSIDTIEIVARELGMDAEQVMVPPDYLLLDPTILPAVVVVRLPSGYTHFVLVWRKVGAWLQIMDPAGGRRWVRARDFLATVYVHLHPVPAAGWREWAGSEAAVAVLRRRIVEVAGDAFARTILERTLAESGWVPLARLDAATRMASALVRNGALRRGGEGARFLETLMRRDDTGRFAEAIPGSFWSVLLHEDETRLTLRGAVLIRIGRATRSDPKTMRREVAAAVHEPPPRPLRRVVEMLAPAARRGLPLLAVVSILLGAAGIAEGLLFRALFPLIGDAGLPQERLMLVGAFAAFAVLLLLVEYRLAVQTVGWGRDLAARFGSALFAKLAALRSEYFGSRIVSDLADRAHAVNELRALPLIGSRLLRSAAGVVITVAMLMWIVPGSALALVLGTLLLLGLAFAFEPVFAEIDMRARTHAGALTRFYLDALSGLTTIHAHCAERSVRREHESLLTDWLRTIRAQIRAAVCQTTALSLAGFALVAVLLRRYLDVAEDPTGALLVAYWGLQLPMFAADVAGSVQAWASFRTILLRVLEPLDAQEEACAAGFSLPPEMAQDGVAIAFRRATFAAAGRDVLRDVDLDISPGSSVAIVGASGAGKSTFVSALLGFLQPRAGEVRIDGEPLTADGIGVLRRSTAWIDPGVQLFNAPLEENVRYSTGAAEVARLPFVLSEAELYDVLQRIPDSRMPLGDGGGMLSGGEGQRVRAGRAMMQSRPRLVILDEAFRGLDGGMRARLLRRCRALWSEATFLYVTHDASEAAHADRVLVLEGGRVAEYDTAQALAAGEGSRYAAILAADRAVREEVWSDPSWRRIEMHDGRLAEVAPVPVMERVG